VTFPNPVAGEIHPSSWQRPPGNRDFKVTSPFGPRVLVMPDGKRVGSVHKGMDLGNGREGDPVYAQATGKVVEWRPVLDGVVTIQTDDRQWQLVAAHMRQITVGLGSRVARGQIIGRVGQVGAPGQPHVHIENKKRNLLGRYVAQDPWPLLEDDVSQTIVTRTPFPSPRGYTVPAGSLTAYKPDGSTKTVTFAKPSRATARAMAVITQDPQKAPNGTFLEGNDGAFEGWYIIPSKVTLDPAPPDEDAAEIAKLRAALAAQTARANQAEQDVAQLKALEVAHVKAIGAITG
jgi:hypothetical protein